MVVRTAQRVCRKAMTRERSPNWRARCRDAYAYDRSDPEAECGWVKRVVIGGPIGAAPGLYRCARGGAIAAMGFYIIPAKRRQAKGRFSRQSQRPAQCAHG